VSLFLTLKLIHILSVIAALGSNVTYAFWLRRAGLDRDRLVDTIQGVRQLDRRLANPAYIVAFVTGALMVATGSAGVSFETGWIAAAIVLYVAVAIIGIAVYAPTVRRQLAEAEDDPTSPAYASVATRSTILGLLTVAIVVVIVWLMVTKPQF
jgi:uncharacterized membrane protein